jgi:hypothetical protein
LHLARQKGTEEEVTRQAPRSQVTVLGFEGLNVGNSKLEIHDGEYYSGRDRPYEPSEVEYSP